MKPNSINPLKHLATAGWLFAAALPGHATESDANLVTAVKETYVFRNFLKDDAITTEAKDGTIILTGTVLDPVHKTLAEDTAAGLAGVRAVDNRLTIGEPVAGANADWWTTFKVKNLLMFHRDVSASSTGVSTANGIVTLTGEASSLAQKELTTEYALDVQGVTSVENNMTVAAALPVIAQTAAQQLDDASITAQVKAALKSHKSTSEVTTKVATRDGVVTVTGMAKNPAEKTLVTKLVDGINGVTRVINDMTVPVTETTQR